MYKLGLSCYYHDAAAALLRDGEIIAAAQEERFSRTKHDPSFPRSAINYCIKEAGIDVSQIDHVVFYEKPFLKFERLLETYLAFAPLGLASFATSMPVWIKGKLFQKRGLIAALSDTLGNDIDWSKKIQFSDHHQSHAASAFYPSPFKSAAILTMDAVGEWTTTSWSVGDGKDLELKEELHFPHSLGLLYSAFTHYCGFRVNSGEYKLMGLAPFGSPIFVEKIKNHLIDIAEDGSFRMNMRYFDYCTGKSMTNSHFNSLFGGPALGPDMPVKQLHMDLAASVQKVVEEVIVKLATHIRKQSGESNLCLAGGVALNCVANRALKRAEIFDNIWVQPAAGDAGGAVGAALAFHHRVLGAPRSLPNNHDRMKGALLGPGYSDQEVAQSLNQLGASFSLKQEHELIDQVARALQEGKVVGWMNGRMEFGPRALGARSILADPRRADMQRKLNQKIKFRESFRPFAPAVLAEAAADWFDLENDSPYMLFVADIVEDKKRQATAEELDLTGFDQMRVERSVLPSVTHVDYTARVQTVDGKYNSKFHALLTQFEKLTGCPVLINTSFNVRGEPIVCTPEDAYRCFMDTEMDMLVIENNVLLKVDQNDPSFKPTSFQPD